MVRKYSKSASKNVKSAMERRKKGTLKRGKGGRGGTVKSRKQAIAMGLSEARQRDRSRDATVQTHGIFIPSLHEYKGRACRNPPSQPPKW
jgi:Family of unknown function (DUF6496)